MSNLECIFCFYKHQLTLCILHFKIIIIIIIYIMYIIKKSRITIFYIRKLNNKNKLN